MKILIGSKFLLLSILIGSVFVSFNFGAEDGRINSKWELWARKTYLRGANIYQRHRYPELDGPEFMGKGPVGPPYTQEDFNRLAKLGANYVNISHPGLFTERPPYKLDPKVQNNLDKLLNMIAKADMFAVITFRTGPGRSEFWAFWGEDTVSDPEDGWFDPSYYNNRIWGDKKAQDAWVAMWRYTAEHYKNNPIVVGYDLMCEPNSNDVGSYPLSNPLDIWDPEEFYGSYGGTLYDWNQLYPKITSAIRKVDPNTPILIGGMAYSSIEWLPYLKPTGDDKTVYIFHQYEPFQYTHQIPPLKNTYPGEFDIDEDGKKDSFNKSWLENLLSTADKFMSSKGVRVGVNEFGAMRWEPGVSHFVGDETGIFEKMGINYAIWLWECSYRPYVEEVNAFDFRFGPLPGNTTEVNTSPLLEVLKKHWKLNTARPSNVSFSKGKRFKSRR